MKAVQKSDLILPSWMLAKGPFQRRGICLEKLEKSPETSRFWGFSLLCEGGLDLRCGGGHLGLQGAPGALPSALGFNFSKCKKKTAILSDDCFFLVREGGLDLPCGAGRLGLQDAPSAMPYWFALRG